MTNAKPVAKSLHTVTVLVQVARLHAANGVGANLTDGAAATEKALDAAMDTLGLTGREDPWGTRAAALKQLTASPKA